MRTGFSKAARVCRHPEGGATDFAWADVERFIREGDVEGNSCYVELSKAEGLF